MAKKKIQEATPPPAEKEKHKIIIDWDGPLIADLIILSVIVALCIGGGIFIYFFDFNLSGDSMQAINEFFSATDITPLIKSFSAPMIISGLSYLLFFSYRVMKHRHNPKWIKALLNLLYLGLVAGIVYYNWYYCEEIFAEWAGFWRYILWANSVACGIILLLYYSVAVYVNYWSKPWDAIITFGMMILFPVVVAVGFVVLCVGTVIAAIHIPGRLIQKSVDSDLAARASSGRKEYTVRHESGYEETVYSDNGSDFYGSDHSYIGHKD